MLTLHIPGSLLKGKYRLLLKKWLWKKIIISSQTKKRCGPFGCAIKVFFGAQPTFIRKQNKAQQQFFGDLVLYISCDFPSRSNLVEEVLYGMVQKTMNLHVLLYLKSATIVFVYFDFQISKGNVNTFGLVINYLSDYYIFMHGIVGLFEMHDTVRFSMVGQ
jgi:hypothetical protein